MNEDVKLLICDIDGTLSEKGGTPLPKTEKVLRTDAVYGMKERSVL